MVSFDGAVALVTGAASGIAHATCDRLRSLGAQVVGADLTADDWIEACDVRDEAAVDALVEGVVRRYGRLDLAVNAAGMSGTSALTHERTTEAWSEMLALNLTGVFFCQRAELRAMLVNQRGSIVNIASMAGLGAAPG